MRKDVYARGALDVLERIGFDSMRLPKDVKVTLDALYASLVEIRLEEVVKPRMQVLGPVKVEQ